MSFNNVHRTCFASIPNQFSITNIFSDIIAKLEIGIWRRLIVSVLEIDIWVGCRVHRGTLETNRAIEFAVIVIADLIVCIKGFVFRQNSFVFMSVACEINCFPVKLVKATFYWVVGCTNKALAAFESMLFAFWYPSSKSVVCSIS